MTAATTDSNEERLPPVLTPQRPFQLKVGCFTMRSFILFILPQMNVWRLFEQAKNSSFKCLFMFFLSLLTSSILACVKPA